MKQQTRLINIRVTEKEKRAMQNLANKHTDGNLSKWIKIMAMRDVIALDKKKQRGKP